MKLLPHLVQRIEVEGLADIDCNHTGDSQTLHMPARLTRSLHHLEHLETRSLTVSIHATITRLSRSD